MARHDVGRTDGPEPPWWTPDRSHDQPVLWWSFASMVLALRVTWWLTRQSISLIWMIVAPFVVMVAILLIGGYVIDNWNPM